MENGTLFIIISQIAVAVVTVLALIVKDHLRQGNEERKRRWAKEDQQKIDEATAATLKHELSMVAALAQQRAEQAIQRAEQATNELKLALASAQSDRVLAEESRKVMTALMIENTRLTERVGVKADQAHHAANNVNEKILKGGLMLRDPASRSRVSDVVSPSGIPVMEAPVTVIAHREEKP
jgi:hypothetical protein